MAPIDWILVVSTGIGGLFGLCCLFDGARRLALYGANSASGSLIAIGAAICLALAGYAYWQADFVDFVMWLVSGAAALVFGALFAREPAPQPLAEPDTITIVKIEPVLAPPVAERAPPPAAVAAPAPAPAPAPAKPAVTAPPAAAKPASAPLLAVPPKPAVGLNTMPLAKPSVGGDTVPLPKPSVGGDTVPLAKPAVGGDTVPVAKPAVGSDTVPLPKPDIVSVTTPLPRPSVGDDTIPLAKPAPGAFTPPKKS